jgi:digeranylgeranylglycerophospholipid reductase
MGVQGPQVLMTDRGNRRHAVDCDVVVVGGGPAGLIAARELATAGFGVRVLEEHDVIGAPVHCTGVLGLDAFDELSLSRRAIVGAADAARFVSPNGTTVVIDAERVRAAVVDRGIFDRDLADSAVDAGAAIHTGVRVASVTRGPQSVTIRTADAASATIHARAAILACGASYRFNRALGLGVPSVLVHSAQLEVPFPPLDQVQVHFGRKIAPGGFAWVVPFAREGTTFARVGLLCERDAGARFRVFADSIRAACGLCEPWPAPRLRVLPLGPVTRTWTDRILAVGDAAGLVKPTTGGGIYYGLLTGHLAAGVLAEALADDRLGARRLKEYERRWRARLGPEIRAGLAFRAVAAKLNDVAVDRLVELARVDGIVPLLKQTADFNWHHTAARALLRHAEFRRIVFRSMWT